MSDHQVAASAYPTTSASQAASHTLPPIRPIDVNYYLTAGIRGGHWRYIDNRAFAGAIRSQTRSARAGYGGNYLVVSSVTANDLARIENLRDEHYKQLRFMYLDQAQALIVRITLRGVEDVAASGFRRILASKTAQMGLQDDLIAVGATKIHGTASSKEADAAFKPKSSRPAEGDWPTLVVECGVSRSIARLRSEADWWLKTCSESVNIVLLLAISEVNQTMHLEQWERLTPVNLPATQHDSPGLNTTLVRTVNFDILQPVAPSGTLTLGFTKLFLRQPAPYTSEGDITITPSDLEYWARQIWSST
ncbi:hypothetical protein HOY80DRAFT_939012 [Tuber brumale]|nr:hypothetical protein HOY80DRAFT_939012 [Tuber brumale]